MRGKRAIGCGWPEQETFRLDRDDFGEAYIGLKWSPCHKRWIYWSTTTAAWQVNIPIGTITGVPCNRTDACSSA